MFQSSDGFNQAGAFEQVLSAVFLRSSATLISSFPRRSLPRSEFHPKNSKSLWSLPVRNSPSLCTASSHTCRPRRWLAVLTNTIRSPRVRFCESAKSSQISFFRSNNSKSLLSNSAMLPRSVFPSTFIFVQVGRNVELTFEWLGVTRLICPVGCVEQRRAISSWILCRFVYYSAIIFCRDVWFVKLNYFQIEKQASMAAGGDKDKKAKRKSSVRWETITFSISLLLYSWQLYLSQSSGWERRRRWTGSRYEDCSFLFSLSYSYHCIVLVDCCKSQIRWKRKASRTKRESINTNVQIQHSKNQNDKPQHFVFNSWDVRWNLF